MAKPPADAKLGAAGAHLMEFSQQMQQDAKTELRGPSRAGARQPAAKGEIAREQM